MTFVELREKYQTFVYEDYRIEWTDEELILTFNFVIPGLTSFSPKTRIPRKFIVNDNLDDNTLEAMVFQVGLIEMISYYKCCCPKKIIVACGYLDDEQVSFFKKLIYYGLGEFLYTNGISVEMDELVDICSTGKKKELRDLGEEFSGILLPIGGGKDSCVSLEILKDYDVMPVIQNPKDVMKRCVEAAGLKIDDCLVFTREICKDELKRLHSLGFLNGHTPFSSLLAFELSLLAYLSKKKYIVLSNENSANEGTVLGTKINHQYSKSFEFERDFQEYFARYFPLDIHYFSFLRPLNEFQIGMLFSNYKAYHGIFRSCNVGSKASTWEWCGVCPKCLFVYIILSPYLYRDELVSIFGKDLFDDENLLPIFKELLGETGVKPFECVGEVSEVKYALALLLNNYSLDLPVLLKYYKEHYDLDISLKLECYYNKEHAVPRELEERLKKELDKYV